MWKFKKVPIANYDPKTPRLKNITNKDNNIKKENQQNIINSLKKERKK